MYNYSIRVATVAKGVESMTEQELMEWFDNTITDDMVDCGINYALHRVIEEFNKNGQQLGFKVLRCALNKWWNENVVE